MKFLLETENSITLDKASKALSTFMKKDKRLIREVLEQSLKSRAKMSFEFYDDVHDCTYTVYEMSGVEKTRIPRATPDFVFDIIRNDPDWKALNLPNRLKSTYCSNKASRFNFHNDDGVFALIFPFDSVDNFGVVSEDFNYNEQLFAALGLSKNSDAFQITVLILLDQLLLFTLTEFLQHVDDDDEELKPICDQIKEFLSKNSNSVSEFNSKQWNDFDSVINNIMNSTIKNDTLSDVQNEINEITDIPLVRYFCKNKFIPSKFWSKSMAPDVFIEHAKLKSVNMDGMLNELSGEQKEIWFEGPYFAFVLKHTGKDLE
jgi:hypothetical protein